MECLRGKWNISIERQEKWSGREDLSPCPFRDKCNIFKELQERKISVHGEFVIPGH
jgi:hypothetical protein